MRIAGNGKNEYPNGHTFLLEWRQVGYTPKGCFVLNMVSLDTFGVGMRNEWVLKLHVIQGLRGTFTLERQVEVGRQ